MSSPWSRTLFCGLGCCLAFAAPAQTVPFRVGVDVFLEAHTKLVKGLRVGLLTNQTGRNAAGQSTGDLLHRHPDVKLVALFAPEHGIRGTVKAGERVDDTRDAATGLPVYSLYGIKGHAPTDEMFALIDVLVYDIQDVGSRAYTYIWSMAETLAAAGRNGKPVVILDRPNPMTCHPIDGPVTEDQWRSFLGLYPIPRVYGMTVGELARYFNGEYGLNCRLIVIPMSGYRRTTRWEETGLEWVPSSPNIPSVESARCFATTGTIGEIGTLDIGIGTYYPFQIIGAAWLNAQASADELNAVGLPGVQFVPTKPYQRPGQSVTMQGLFLRITDSAQFYPSATEVVLLNHLLARYPQHFRWPQDSYPKFDKATGTSAVREGLQRGRPVAEIIGRWQPEQVAFRERRAKYLIYQ